MPGNSAERWLFGRRTDLLAFGGSAALSLLLLALGAALGVLHGDTPTWGFLAVVVLVDVAHVWGSLFRVYLDPDERVRRPALYALVPLGCFMLGTTIHAISGAWFWRCVAYLAVFHFIRQQNGFLSLYQRRAPTGVWEQRFEQLTCYVATGFPIVYWHAHLPQAFAWMMQGDFVSGLSTAVVDASWPVYLGVLGAYAALQIARAIQGAIHWGKLLLIATTALCWNLGIITFSSDYAFTVTNVLIHGIPYAVLVYRYARARGRVLERGSLGVVARKGVLGVVAFVCVLWGLALAEEAAWHAFVFGDQAALFGAATPLEVGFIAWVAPLLATPQLTHYVLDGLVWRGSANPTLRTPSIFEA